MVDGVVRRKAQRRKAGRGVPLREVVEQVTRSAPLAPAPSRVPPALAQLAAYRRAAEAQRARLAQLVAEARGQGATWAEIGRALGVSGQAAHKRFSTATPRSGGASPTSRSGGGGS